MNKSKLNIVFIGHDLKFLFPLIEHLQSKDMFELRIIQHSCHEIIDEAEAQNALTCLYVPEEYFDKAMNVINEYKKKAAAVERKRLEKIILSRVLITLSVLLIFLFLRVMLHLK